MTGSIFITLLTVFATATGLITEAVKKVLDEMECNYSANVLACVVGGIVGVGGTICYYLFAGIAITSINIVSLFMMGIASAIGAMVGYDKIIQMIKQING